MVVGQTVALSSSSSVDTSCSVVRCLFCYPPRTKTTTKTAMMMITMRETDNSSAKNQRSSSMMMTTQEVVPTTTCQLLTWRRAGLRGVCYLAILCHVVSHIPLPTTAWILPSSTFGKTSTNTMPFIATTTNMMTTPFQSHHPQSRTCGSLLSMSSESSSSESSSSSPPIDQVQQWQEQAQRLRDEISTLETAKESMKEQERKVAQIELDIKRDYLERYSVIIPILKPDGSTVDERVTFPPRLVNITQEENDDTSSSSSSSSSTILLYEASLPLGMILGEHETLFGMICVNEVLPDCNARQAGIQEGDLVRAMTACQMEMDQSNTWQLLVGGIGRPKTLRYMYSVDYQSFESVMDAVLSNRMDPQGRSVLFVIERLIT